MATTRAVSVVPRSRREGGLRGVRAAQAVAACLSCRACGGDHRYDQRPRGPGEIRRSAQHPRELALQRLDYLASDLLEYVATSPTASTTSTRLPHFASPTPAGSSSWLVRREATRTSADTNTSGHDPRLSRERFRRAPTNGNFRRDRTVQPGIGDGHPETRTPNPFKLGPPPRLSAPTVKSPVRREADAGFGVRHEETGQWQYRNRAPRRLNHRMAHHSLPRPLGSFERVARTGLSSRRARWGSGPVRARRGGRGSAADAGEQVLS